MVVLTGVREAAGCQGMWSFQLSCFRMLSVHDGEDGSWGWGISPRVELWCAPSRHHENYICLKDGNNSRVLKMVPPADVWTRCSLQLWSLLVAVHEARPPLKNVFRRIHNCWNMTFYMIVALIVSSQIKNQFLIDYSWYWNLWLKGQPEQDIKWRLVTGWHKSTTHARSRRARVTWVLSSEAISFLCGQGVQC